MALPAALAWEVRTDGDNDNGSGYSDLGGASTDYTQQAAAELSLTDLAMVNGGTTLTSATGGFGSDLVGNCIYIKSGTNFTQGYYQITGYNNANSVEIDRDATSGGNGSSGVGEVGGARGRIDETFLERIVAGNTVWMKSGEYGIPNANQQIDNGGNASNYIRVYGYKTTRGDEPIGDDRPLIDMGSKYIDFGNHVGGFWDLRHLRFTTSTFARGITLDGVDSVIINCKASASYLAESFDLEGAGIRIIDSEGYDGYIGIWFDAVEGFEGIADRCYTHGNDEGT